MRFFLLSLLGRRVLIAVAHPGALHPHCRFRQEFAASYGLSGGGCYDSLHVSVPSARRITHCFPVQSHGDLAGWPRHVSGPVIEATPYAPPACSDALGRLRQVLIAVPRNRRGTSTASPAIAQGMDYTTFPATSPVTGSYAVSRQRGHTTLPRPSLNSTSALRQVGHMPSCTTTTRAAARMAARVVMAKATAGFPQRHYSGVARKDGRRNTPTRRCSDAPV